MIRHYCKEHAFCVKPEKVEAHTVRTGHTVIEFAQSSKPSMEKIERWSDECRARAIDGCGGIEFDGECKHGLPSWPRHLGIV